MGEIALGRTPRAVGAIRTATNLPCFKRGDRPRSRLKFVVVKSFVVKPFVHVRIFLLRSPPLPVAFAAASYSVAFAAAWGSALDRSEPPEMVFGLYTDQRDSRSGGER